MLDWNAKKSMDMLKDTVIRLETASKVQKQITHGLHSKFRDIGGSLTSHGVQVIPVMTRSLSGTTMSIIS